MEPWLKKRVCNHHCSYKIMWSVKLSCLLVCALFFIYRILSMPIVIDDSADDTTGVAQHNIPNTLDDSRIAKSSRRRSKSEGALDLRRPSTARSPVSVGCLDTDVQLQMLIRSLKRRQLLEPDNLDLQQRKNDIFRELAEKMPLCSETKRKAIQCLFDSLESL